MCEGEREGEREGVHFESAQRRKDGKGESRWRLIFSGTQDVGDSVAQCRLFGPILEGRGQKGCVWATFAYLLY